MHQLDFGPAFCHANDWGGAGGFQASATVNWKPHSEPRAEILPLWESGNQTRAARQGVTSHGRGYFWG